MLDVLKMPTAIEEHKLLSELFPDVLSAPLEGSLVPTRVIATGASDGAANVAVELVAAEAQKRVPLQTRSQGVDRRSHGGREQEALQPIRCAPRSCKQPHHSDHTSPLERHPAAAVYARILSHATPQLVSASPHLAHVVPSVAGHAAPHAPPPLATHNIIPSPAASHEAAFATSIPILCITTVHHSPQPSLSAKNARATAHYTAWHPRTTTRYASQQASTDAVSAARHTYSYVNGS